MDLTDEQRRAVERLDENLCVVAGAGTGKTRVLVERYLRLLSDARLGPEQIAAITFTEKAAAEMIDRVRRECEQRISQARAPQERAFWQQRRTGLAAGHIGTFHRFCARLLRQYPVEAEVDPRFAVMSEGEQQLSKQRSARETVRRLFEAGGEDIRLVARAYSLRRLSEILKAALERRPQVLRAAATAERPPDEQLAELRRMVAEAQSGALAALLADAEFQKAARLLPAARGQEDDLAEAARQQAVAALELIGSKTALAEQLEALRMLAQLSLRGGKVKKWPSQELMKQIQAALKVAKQAAAETLKDCAVSDAANWPDELRLARSLTRVALEAVHDYQAAKAAAQQLDYDDLLLKARDLLAQHPEARARLASRFRQILVDELQDTDQLQVEILGLLLGRGPAGELRPKPGSFFGVGDPKQSIYRFRGADVEVFRGIARSFGDEHVAKLTRTFRFHQGHADVTNKVFEALLKDDFTALEAEEQSKPPVSVEVLLVASGEEKLRAGDAVAAEAALIARRIARLHDEEGAGYGDVALLMHRQTQGYRYEEALSRARIPFYVVSGRRFYEQQEVRDVTVALRALGNPGDELSLASLLRSPFFGVSDDGLTRLCEAGDLRALSHPQFPVGCHRLLAAGVPRSGEEKKSTGCKSRRAGMAPTLPWNGKPGMTQLRASLTSAAVREKLSADDAEKCSRAAAWLEHFTSRAGRIGVAQLIQEMVFEGLPGGGGGEGPPAASSLAHALLPQFLGEQRYANLRRLVDLTRQLDQAGEARLEDVLARLQSSITEGVEEAEAPLSAEGRDAVLLMTVHKAKGLEFPYVFLVNADVARRETGEPFYPCAGFGLAASRPDRPVACEEPALYSILKAADQQLELDEFRRLFYVGATRAQRRLFVTGARDMQRGSWLADLTSALGIELADELEQTLTVEPAPGSAVRVEVAPAESGGPRSRGGKKGRLTRLFEAGRFSKEALQRLTAGKAESKAAQRLIRQVAAVPEDAAALRLPATALADFGRCPALFYYKHVLGMPGLAQQGGGPGLGGPYAAAVGQMVHEHLRQMDFRAPKVNQQLLERLARQSSRITPRRRPEATGEAARLVEKFIATPLAEELATARTTWRETPFLLKLQGLTISGVLDLLFQNARGDWVLVDYKTDRLGAEEAASRAGDYEIQVNIYAKAAQTFLGIKLKNSCLAFLDAGIIFSISAASEAGCVASLKSAVRTGIFRPVADCGGPCEYAGLCRSQ